MVLLMLSAMYQLIYTCLLLSTILNVGSICCISLLIISMFFIGLLLLQVINAPYDSNNI